MATTTFDSSFESTICPGEMGSPAIRNQAKEILKSRIFLGRYIERRLVDQSIGYRDIVLLSAAEIELQRDLIDTKHKLKSNFNQHWIGITDSESLDFNVSGVCLWTEIDKQPFGVFWFQIKNVSYRENEILIKVKCVRHLTESFIELEPLLTGTIKVPKTGDIETEKMKLATSLTESYLETMRIMRTALSITNIKEALTFLFAFIIAIFTGSTAFINFVGNFVLALLREMSIFVNNSTPMFLGILDVFCKIIGGFYLLLAMLLRPSNSTIPVRAKRRITSRQDYYDNSID